MNSNSSRLVDKDTSSYHPEVGLVGTGTSSRRGLIGMGLTGLSLVRVMVLFLESSGQTWFIVKIYFVVH